MKTPIHPRRVVRRINTVQLWRVRLWLKKQNLFAAIDTTIEADKSTKPAIWEAWNHGYVIGRGDKLLKRLNLTPTQVEAMFAAASKVD